ncbi:MAG: hypothetical protein RIT28_2852 [Pseudomonadota bacterium]
MRVLVVSDVHLGNGGVYDIYAGGAALPALIRREAGPDLHLLLNGDAVDFLLSDDPLVLELGQVVRAAEAIARHPETRAVLEAIGELLARGGQATVRLGNHDVELAIPEVQAAFRAATGQPPEVAGRLRFEAGDTPGVLTVGGVRVLYTHGEHNDAWNRVAYDDLNDRGRWPRFRHPPGSELVKNILNPLKRDFGMRFADLLKPDFHGAVMAGLAVDPSAVRVASPKEVAGLAARLMRQRLGPATFGPGDEDSVDVVGPLEDIADAAELTDEERELLAGLLSPGPAAFSASDAEDSATQKLLKAALRAYARAHKSLAKGLAEAYFSLEPDAAEWKEAKRLAGKFEAEVVLIGHTHAARFRADEGVVYANTGTWIGLMRLPDAEASNEEWMRFLTTLKSNPGLDPSLGPAVPVITRFTGVEVHDDPDGGAQVALVEWRGEERVVLQSVRVSPRS